VSNGVKKPRVLVADDATGIRDLLCLLLAEEAGFDVVAACGDGAEAIRLADDREPDVVVLDALMPKVDGLQALPEIRQRLPTATIVMMSGRGSREQEVESLALGADSFVEKSLGAAALIEQIVAATEGGPGR
jgi:DNA-binding response OmpR family regulator